MQRAGVEGWGAGAWLCAAMGLGLGALAWQVNAGRGEWSDTARSREASAASVSAPAVVPAAWVQRTPAPAQLPSLTWQWQQSFASAQPLLAMMRAGMVLADDDIFDADVGLLEPALLVHAAHRRDVVALALACEQANGIVHPEQLITPAALSSAQYRARLRALVVRRVHATAEFRGGVQQTNATSRRRLQAAMSLWPADRAQSSLRAFDEASAALAGYATGLHASAQTSADAVVALLDAIERNPTIRLAGARSLQLHVSGGEAAADYRRLLSAALNGFEHERQLAARYAGAPLLDVTL